MVEHSVHLRGLALHSLDRGPTNILQRTDEEFLAAILEELTVDPSLTTAARSVAKTFDKNGILMLYQPVQRTFNVVLFEVFCEEFGNPRLDPECIESTGLVLRRIAVDQRGQPANPSQMEGWVKAGNSLRGWVPFPNRRDEDLDPDPACRPPELRAGHPEIDRRLALQAVSPMPFIESVSPLFVAPPAVCAAAKRTILYGLVPVTSSEMSEAPPVYPPFAIENVRLHLHRFLKKGGSSSLPRYGRPLTADDANDESLSEFVLMLRQLAIELDAFGNTTESVSLYSALNGIELDFSTQTSSETRPAGEFLKEAALALVERPPSNGGQAPSTTLPNYWPELTDQQAEQIAKATQMAMSVRLPVVKAREGRFDDNTRRHKVRAFVRITRDESCPPVTVWSEYSEAFTIAPWYETGDAPPTQISLPNPFDRDFLKRLKPNVAFTVPEELFSLLNNNRPKAFLDGSARRGGGAGGLDWICSFSIPIITICAFIVLNIFLILFDIIFQWMMFIKVCIPFPRRS